MLEIILYDLPPSQGIVRHDQSSTNHQMLLSIESAFDLLLRQETEHFRESAKTLLREALISNQLPPQLRVARVQLATGGQGLGIDFASLGELVSFVVSHLINASTEAYRLSFLPHLELSNFSKAGDFWSIIQSLKRACLSCGRVPRIVLESATQESASQESPQTASTYQMSSMESEFNAPTVSGNDLDDFLASLEPQLSSAGPEWESDQTLHIQNAYTADVADVPPASMDSTAYQHPAYADQSAFFLGAIPAPTVDFMSAEDAEEPIVDPYVSVTSGLRGVPKRRGSSAFVEQIMKFQMNSDHSTAPSPYSRAPPPFAKSVEHTSIVSHVAQSKSVVTDASQISTAWYCGQPYVPLYISTAFVIGGGSTPTDARRWLNRAPPEFQPKEEDYLPAKVAGALPRVRYVRWSFVQRLFLSSGLESSVPKEKLQFLADKMKRYEVLHNYVINDGSQQDTKCSVASNTPPLSQQFPEIPTF